MRTMWLDYWLQCVISSIILMQYVTTAPQPNQEKVQDSSNMNTPNKEMMSDIFGDISPGTEEWFHRQCDELLPISPNTMSILDTLGESPIACRTEISHKLVEETPLEETPLPMGSSLNAEETTVLPSLSINPGLDMSSCVSVGGIKPISKSKERLFEKKCPFYFRPNGIRRQFLIQLPAGEKLRIYKDDAVRLGYIEGPKTKCDLERQ